jgi:hypothetical protein
LDAAYVSALAALAGSAIGGLTSFATAWSTQHTQARAQRLSESRTKRETLYGQFIDEASKLFANALQNQDEQASNLIALYTMINKMRLLSSPQIIQSAEKVVETIVETYRAPAKAFHELHELMISDEMDPLRPFSEACREELRMLGPSSIEKI